MTESSQATQVLDDLLGMLRTAASRSPSRGASGDAIDEALQAPPRSTAVSSLREAPEVEAFRQALVDGLIRADTANQLLRLVNTVLTELL